MNTKETAQQYFSAIAEGRLEDMMKMRSPGFVYWLSGEGSWPFGGFQTPESEMKLWTAVGELFPEGMKMTLRDITADEKTAALQVYIIGKRKDGRIYENHVMLLLTFDGQLVSGMYEYLDTIMVNELFCGKMDDEHQTAEQGVNSASK